MIGILVAVAAFQLPATHHVGAVAATPMVRTAPSSTKIASSNRIALNNLQSPNASPQMSIAKVAACANLASFGLYGIALVLKPAMLMKNVMGSSDEAVWKFDGIPCTVAQYLGACYLAQAARMVTALATASIKSNLVGVGLVQLFLCLTSLGRLAAGIPKNEVTMSLPVGQGLMATLAFLGVRSL